MVFDKIKNILRYTMQPCVKIISDGELWSLDSDASYHSKILNSVGIKNKINTEVNSSDIVFFLHVGEHWKQ